MQLFARVIGRGVGQTVNVLLIVNVLLTVNVLLNDRCAWIVNKFKRPPARWGMILLVAPPIFMLVRRGAELRPP